MPAHGAVPALPVKSKGRELSVVAKVFIFLATVESIALIVIASDALATSADHHEPREVRFAAILSIYVTLGFWYFSLDSVLQENFFQFISALLSHTLIVVYVIWHWKSDNLGHVFHSVSLHMMIGTLVFQLAYLILTPMIQDSFGWLLMKSVGASVTLQEAYKTYSVWLCLLKFDLFMGILLVVLSSFYKFEEESVEVLNIVAMAVTCLWAAFGYLAVRYERRGGSLVFMLFAELEPAYIAYKLWEIHTHPKRFPSDVTLTQFVITGSIALVIRVLLVRWTHACYNNFGKGLKDRVFLKQAQHARVQPVGYMPIGELAAPTV